MGAWAYSATALLSAFADIFNILTPILVMVGLGALLRWRFRLDVATLGKLNIYLFVPAFVFHNVSTSTLQWSDMAGIVAVTVLQVLTLGLIIWGIGRALRVSRATLASIALAVMFYNSGNYGLPLADLAFQSRGAAAQAFVMMSQNILTFTIGMAIAASVGEGGALRGLTTLLRLPVLPTLAAALLAKGLSGSDPNRLPAVLTHTARYISDGMVPIALVTLGAQLASKPRRPRWKPISLVLILRLAIGPVQMAGLLFVLHLLGRAHPTPVTTAMDLWPWPAQILVLTAAVPTAVNTLLLTLELGGDADLAADCVFWTTVFSCVTIPIWLLVVKHSGVF